MTEPLLVDTNVLVRLITGEPEDEFADVEAVFAAGDRGEVELILLPVIIAEAVYVLEGFYEHERRDICDALMRVLDIPWMGIEESDTMRSALQTYANSNLGYADAWLAAKQDRLGCGLHSLDQQLLNLAGDAGKSPRVWTTT